MTPAFRQDGFRQRVGCVFGLQFAIVVSVSLMGMYDMVPGFAVVLVIALSTLLAWLAVRQEWRVVRRLAQLVERWGGKPSDAVPPRLEHMAAYTDADVAALAYGLHGFATRIAGYNQRERSFTRDASHELRSPLTVIKMSVDMLGDEERLSDFGARSVRRIQRASMEMEALVDALLVLAREPDEAANEERFVVNDVLRSQLESARELLSGRPIELRLDEAARFALSGSARAFSVLCWQLIRNACQQTDEGRVVIRVTPGMVSVSSVAAPVVAAEATRSRHARGASRHGFEMAIARRISDRFAWPLELLTGDDRQNVACIHFAETLPAEPVVNGAEQMRG